MNQLLNQKPLWKVVRITDIQIFSPSTGATQGKRVEYQLANGTLSYVEVPMTEFTEDRVTGLIEDAASAMYAVLALQSPDTIGSSGMMPPPLPGLPQ